MFSVRKCAARRAWERNETKRNASRAVQNMHHTKVQKKRGINYDDDPAGILYIRETPRQYEILLRILHIDVSSHIYCVLLRGGLFVYLPNPEPSDISIWYIMVGRCVNLREF